MPNPKPEVLAPAGTLEALRAAVGAGADAVYFGLQDWNARVRARNFELGDLPDVLRDLRRWGVKSYLTFNTLVFHEETRGARDALEAIAEAGPDGIIVQDLGMLRLAREVAPAIKLHASTQMTIASPDGVRLVASLGVQRVILARELTIPEIARIRAAVDTELEVFVHGALCVSYSGQCLSSEAWGGRSANRGQCAQACRLPYDLMVDGKRRDLGHRAYLLSPRDLEGGRRIPELTSLGIAAFKIEGRMKSPEYVAASTAYYREAVDRAWENQNRRSGDPAPAPRASLGRLAAESRQVFSRGVSEGFLGGVNHQLLVDGTTRAHRGARVGTVLSLELDAKGKPRGVIMEETPPEAGSAHVALKPGDGILLAATPLEEDEVGGRLLSADPIGRAGHRILEFPRASMPDLEKVTPGTPVYRTSDPVLLERLRRDLEHPERKRQVSLRAEVFGAEGEPLTLRLTDPEGRTVEVESLVPLEPATRHALDAASLREQMERMGGTRYRVAGLEARVDGRVFLPVSELNRIRREAVDLLEELRGALPADAARAAAMISEAAPAVEAPQGDAPAIELTGDPEGAAPGECAAEMIPSPVAWAIDRVTGDKAEDFDAVGQDAAGVVAGSSARAGRADPSGARHAGPESSRSFDDAVVILCRDAEQVRGALDAGARGIALDFLDLVGLKESSRDLAAAGVRRTLALPRVQKPGEERIESFFLGLAPEELLVRSLGSLERLRHLRLERSEVRSERLGAGEFPLLVGDVSLNAVNPVAIEILLGLGLSRVTPGMDLNGEQLESLVAALGPAAARCEISLHHHLPLFHTEHCVFAAFLSDGADFRTCGRPCDRHRIALRDRTGHAHPVVADVGCRNTVFGARPLSALAHLRALRAAGVEHFRVEMISQDRAATARLVDLHRSVWDGRIAVADAQAMMQAESAYGISIGSPEPPRGLGSRPAGSRAKPAGAGMPRFRPPDRLRGKPRQEQGAAEGRSDRAQPASPTPTSPKPAGRTAVSRPDRPRPTQSGRARPPNRSHAGEGERARRGPVEHPFPRRDSRDTRSPRSTPSDARSSRSPHGDARDTRSRHSDTRSPRAPRSDTPPRGRNGGVPGKRSGPPKRRPRG